MCAGQTDHHIPTEAMIESATGCTATQVAEMQENVSSALDHDTGAISAVRVLHLYLERLLINQFDVRPPPPPLLPFQGFMTDIPNCHSSW